MVLTKTEILEGAKRIEEIELTTMNGSVQIRPLTQSELDELSMIESKAMGEFSTNEKTQRQGKRQNASQMISEGKINIEKTTKANQEKKMKAVYLSLNIEGTNKDSEIWSEKEIGEIQAATFDEIYEAIEKLNHIGEDISLEKEIDEFPE